MATKESAERDLAIAKTPQVNVRVREATTTKKKFNALWFPHIPLPSRAYQLVTLVYILVAGVLWVRMPESLFPGPLTMVQTFSRLWVEQALGREILTSLVLNLHLILCLILLGFAVVVMRSLGATKGLVTLLGNFRFLGMTGITLILTFYTSGAHSLKLSILVFSVGSFFVSAISRMVDAVPQAERDYARTLGMTEWESMYEVDLRGRLAEFIELLRQNQAMGWMMLTMVEGVAKSEGGVGTLLLQSQRTWSLPEVYTIQVTLWFLGLGIDYLFLRGRKLLPWADLRATRR